jgi:hypothetical protein
MSDTLRDPTKHFIEDDDFFRSQRDELPLDGEGMEFATLREEIAELRLLVPKLCSAVTELQAEIARLRAAPPEGDAR